MSFDPGKGHPLEQQIAEFLRQHGYTVSTNARIQGRSGATHELDVVADKSDDLTSYRLIVECKAWTSAIDKEVVYKLAEEIGDLSAARGLIVAPSGWTVQAAQAASQQNIDLWGANELRTRFGADAIREIQTRWTQVETLGRAFTVAREAADQALQRVARGKLGLARDEMVWSGQVWLPVWLLQLAITKHEGAIRKVPRVTRRWNGYDALSAQLASTGVVQPSLVTVDVSSGYIAPVLQRSVIATTITKVFGHWQTVTMDAAKHRHAETLAQMGLQVPFNEISIEETTLTYHPLWIAFLRKKDRERIAVVDGTTGKEWVDGGHLLTAHAQLVREALAGK
jgi:hypothetical protein